MLRVRCWCLSFLLLLFGCGEGAGRCGVCERQRHPGMGAELTLASGQGLATCCLSCALHFSEKLETPARRFKVEDHAGGGLLDVESAYVVEGSRLNPCLLPSPREAGTRTPLRLSYDRCAPSMVAFRQVRQARDFIARHGGTLQPPGHLSSSELLRR
ncbi:MAG: hypothetical protein O7F16_11950 [Acidobacteria bacterium]|nr:hypothetical protein [Acidobacteriota bacterium]